MVRKHVPGILWLGSMCQEYSGKAACARIAVVRKHVPGLLW
jgi:hypothetical protein